MEFHQLIEIKANNTVKLRLAEEEVSYYILYK